MGSKIILFIIKFILKIKKTQKNKKCTSQATADIRLKEIAIMVVGEIKGFKTIKKTKLGKDLITKVGFSKK